MKVVGEAPNGFRREGARGIMDGTRSKDRFITILVAEDDPDDQFLIQGAFESCEITGSMVFVENGEELLDYLFRRERYQDANAALRPSCLLLDLNMPLMDGREALWRIRQASEYRQMPIVVLTTSDSPEDREYCMDLGVSRFFTKPDTFDELLHLMHSIKGICRYPSDPDPPPAQEA